MHTSSRKKTRRLAFVKKQFNEIIGVVCIGEQLRLRRAHTTIRTITYTHYGR